MIPRKKSRDAKINFTYSSSFASHDTGMQPPDARISLFIRVHRFTLLTQGFCNLFASHDPLTQTFSHSRHTRYTGIHGQEARVYSRTGVKFSLRINSFIFLKERVFLSTAHFWNYCSKSYFFHYRFAWPFTDIEQQWNLVSLKGTLTIYSRNFSSIELIRSYWWICFMFFIGNFILRYFKSIFFLSLYQINGIRKNEIKKISVFRGENFLKKCRSIRSFENQWCNTIAILVTFALDLDE